MTNLTLKDIAAGLMSVQPMDVSKRYIRDVSMESMPVTLEIGQLFALVRDNALKRNIVQRNDALRRAEGKAKHIVALHAAHLDIVIAYWNGEYHLVDGCHRVGHWFENRCAEVPSQVTVLLKMPKSEGEYLSLYGSYDSKKSTKSRADALYGYLRYMGVDDLVSSEVFRKGQWATAFNVLHKTSRNAQELDTVRLYLAAILAVDKHNFTGHDVPQAFILAALRLYRALDERAPVMEYINALRDAYLQRVPFFSPSIGNALNELKVYNQMCGGAHNREFPMTRLAQIIEEGFTNFCLEQVKRPAEEFVRLTSVAVSTAHDAVLN
jgi:hypothetical protein